LPTNTITSGPVRLGLKLLGFLVLSSTLGCSDEQYIRQDDLDQRILPPRNIDLPAILSTPKKPVQDASGVIQTRLDPPKLPKEVDSEKARLPVLPQGTGASPEPAQTLTLPEAIETAFRQQPRLRVYLESVEQARRGEEIAFAPFLPTAGAGYSVGGFDLDVGGKSTPVGPLPGFTFLPALGSIPIGLNINTGYELAELKLQWLICDFGRRLGRYHQAGLAVDIAQLQAERAYQTVANEVSAAYYTVLRTRALRNTAAAAVHRFEVDLEEVKKVATGGDAVKAQVLGVEVLLAQSKQVLDAAESAEAVAVAALNLAIGLNINVPTCLDEHLTVPPFPQSLAECLQTAVGQRREFQVARQSVAVAEEGRNVARADFAPRVVAEGSLFDFQQSDPRGHADLALGFIKLEWGLFEGGKRVAELHASDSKIRAAMAQADSIADTIAFQVTEAYHLLTTARRGIDRSRLTVTETKELLRITKEQRDKGTAKPTELASAENALTSAQMAYFNSIHDYLIALARLEYAMGVTPTPGSSYGHR
jgi:outer membrane protein